MYQARYIICTCLCIHHLHLPHAENSTLLVIGDIVCHRIDSLKIMYTIKYINIGLYHLICYSKYVVK